jgi:hypothetical protein
MPSRKVSLSLELHLISRALDGMKMMTGQWRDNHFIESELPRLAHALHATLVLVRERMVILECAVRDTLDPKYVLCEENEAFDPLLGDDHGDVVLKAWSAKKEAEKLEREAKRAAHHLEVLEKRRRRRQEDEQE